MNDQTAEKRIEWLITQLEGRELQYKTFKRDRDEITLTLGDTRALVDTYKALKAENARLRGALKRIDAELVTGLTAFKITSKSAMKSYYVMRSIVNGALQTEDKQS